MRKRSGAQSSRSWSHTPSLEELWATLVVQSGAALLAGDESMKPGGQGSILQDRRGLCLHEPFQSQLLDFSQGLPLPCLLQCLAQMELLLAALHPGEQLWDPSLDDCGPLYLCVMQLI